MENMLPEKLDPKQFGLDEKNVSTIEQAFLPKIAEREALLTIYNQLITEELTPDLCIRAADLRKKAVKVRTGIAEIHKTQKAFFLAAGRYVDAWKNKETVPVEQMEAGALAIETHFEKIEEARIAALEAERVSEVAKYTEQVPAGLGNMDAGIYSAMLTGLRVAFEEKQKAEAEAEAARIEAEKAAAAKEVEEAAERERIRVENEKLRAEKVAADLAAAKAAKAAADLLKAEQDKAAAAAKAAADLTAKKEAEAAAILKAEQDKAAAEKAKLEAEIAKSKAEAAAKIAADLAAAKAAAAAPDKEKLLHLISAINSIQLPTLSTPDAVNICNDVKLLLAKVTNYITEKTTKL